MQDSEDKRARQAEAQEKQKLECSRYDNAQLNS